LRSSGFVCREVFGSYRSEVDCERQAVANVGKAHAAHTFSSGCIVAMRAFGVWIPMEVMTVAESGCNFAQEKVVGVEWGLQFRPKSPGLTMHSTRRRNWPFAQTG
jgi:hypothetical protein